PSIQFANPALNMGGYVNRLVKPIVNTIEDVINPVRPFLDLLYKVIPGLNDLPSSIINAIGFDQDHDGKVTLIDLASLAGYVPPAVLEFLSVVRKVDNLAMQFQSSPNGDNAWINLGAGLSIGGGTDVRGLGNLQGLPIPNDPAAFLDDVKNQL